MSLEDVIAANRGSRDGGGGGRRRRGAGGRAGGRERGAAADGMDVDGDFYGERQPRATPYSRGGQRDRGNVDGHWSHDKFDGPAVRYVENLAPRAAEPERASSTIRFENLHYQVSEADLHHFASGYGEVVNCRIFFDQAGRSEEKAVVTYKTPEQAQQAVAALHNLDIDGKIISVTIVPPKVREPRKGRAAASTSDNRGGGILSRLGQKPGGILARVGPSKLSLAERLGAPVHAPAPAAPRSGGGRQRGTGNAASGGRVKRQPVTAASLDDDLAAYMNDEVAVTAAPDAPAPMQEDLAPAPAPAPRFNPPRDLDAPPLQSKALRAGGNGGLVAGDREVISYDDVPAGDTSEM